ncbi:signal peptide peptidase SppA [Algihabitans albus]|uniref:signal peptide peptidase SppA n=1 Tax=Algihabitans albus TaxID=2164067 RepID=UPI0013C2D450|nr:signal peptide peptidase SppA [Algihabitans albus]
MIRIILFLLKSIVGLLASVGLLLVVVVLVGVFAWREAAETFDERIGFRTAEQALPESMMLELDLSPGVVERQDGGFSAAAFGGPWQLADLIEAIEDAGQDPGVEGILLRLGAGELNIAQVQELRDALIAFRAEDKLVFGFAESFGEAGNGTLHYYLATAIDEIWLQPSGGLDLTGFLLEQPYMREALAGLGITGRFGQREEYKGAVDPLTRDAMSPAVRSNLDRLLASWREQLAEAIADHRGIGLPEARRLIDNGPYLPAQALEAGLVDRLAYLDEIRGLAETHVERVSFQRYVNQREQPETSADAPTVALIYGIGPVVLGHNEGRSPFAGPDMQSGRIVEALMAAAEDPAVEAVVFRVDSPGGSYAASDAIWRAVAQVRATGKPVVISMASLAASGGYFVAAGADRIVAQPGTVTGSIGVVSGKFVLADLWNDLEINWDGVQAGSNAAYWSANRNFTPDQWQKLQTGLSAVYEDFLETVAEGRGLEVAAVRDIAGGRVFTGADAAENGLVDALGGLTVAVAAAKEVAGIAPETEVLLVEFPQEPRFQRFLRDLAGLQADATTLVRLAQVVDRLEPVLRMIGAFEAQGPQMRVAPALEQ